MIKIKKKNFFLIILIGITIILLLLIFIPTKTNSTDIGNYTIIRDDDLAIKFAPIIYTNNEFEIPKKLYYRAAFDEHENYHIAYHILWDREINKTKGFMPFFNKCLYTNGLKIQSLMYGKGDIEVIEVILDKNKSPKTLTYETCKNYNPKDFSVEHSKVSIDKPINSPFKFEVISWNHLFNYISNDQSNDNLNEVTLKPEYFTEQLWTNFEMFKVKETFFKKNRAHFIYERECYK